jgi:hypothetical protein
MSLLVIGGGYLVALDPFGIGPWLLVTYSIKIHSHELSKNAREELFPGMLLTYFLNDSEMVPVAPIIAGITLVFTFHMCCIYIVRSLYFKMLSASFLITFSSPKIATSLNMHVPFSLFRIIMQACCCGWFCHFALAVFAVWLPSPFDFLLLILVHVRTSVFCPVALHSCFLAHVEV